MFFFFPPTRRRRRRIKTLVSRNFELSCTFFSLRIRGSLVFIYCYQSRAKGKVNLSLQGKVWICKYFYATCVRGTSISSFSSLFAIRGLNSYQNRMDLVLELVFPGWLQQWQLEKERDEWVNRRVLSVNTSYIWRTRGSNVGLGIRRGWVLNGAAKYLFLLLLLLLALR